MTAKSYSISLALMGAVGGGLLALAAPASASEPTPPPATDRLFGDFGVGVSYTWLTGNDITSDEASKYWAVDGALRLGLNLGAGRLIQSDLVLENAGDHRDKDTYDWGVLSATHFAWRDARYLVGVFGGYVHTDQDNNSTATSGRYFAGVEGQLFRQNMTYYGQVGWLGGSRGDDDSGEDSFRDAVFGRAVVRYFLDPNMKIETELSGAYGKMDSDSDDVAIVGWGLKLERQFASNISASLGYFGNHYDQSDEDDQITEHVLRAGLTFHFSPGTLLEKDRTGASLDTPAFLRWTAQTGGPLE